MTQADLSEAVRAILKALAELSAVPRTTVSSEARMDNPRLSWPS